MGERFDLDDFREVFVSHNQTVDQDLGCIVMKYPKTGYFDLYRRLPVGHQVEVEGTTLEVTHVLDRSGIDEPRFRHDFVEIRPDIFVLARASTASRIGVLDELHACS